MRILLISLMLLAPLQFTLADDAKPVTTPSVEDNLRAMDKNHDGIVDVSEVREYLEAKHGKHYQQDKLADMESSINGRSCATPFAARFY